MQTKSDAPARAARPDIPVVPATRRLPARSGTGFTLTSARRLYTLETTECLLTVSRGLHGAQHCLQDSVSCSCVREVCRILPPVPSSFSSTLSGVTSRTSTNRAGTAVIETAGNLLHELVVDSHIGQRAADGARCRTGGDTQQRVEKQQSDQRSPESSGYRAGTVRL